jgi:hypothetical protein
MRIIAVDPGAVASGVAAVYSHADTWMAAQYEKPLDAWYAAESDIDGHYDEDVHFIVEDFQTSTQLTREGRATIGLVGFFELTARYYHSYITVVVKSPQHRLSGQREAAELMGGTIDELKRDPARKDAFSALSHCCVYRRTVR